MEEKLEVESADGSNKVDVNAQEMPSCNHI